MASVQAGTYTAGDLLKAAGFDFEREAAADYLEGKPDFRRVQIGGLPFADLEDKIVVPYTADDVVITLDGKTATTLDVTLDASQKEQRKASFEVAADTNGPAPRLVELNSAEQSSTEQ